jgi:hypothetical protein
MFCLLVCSWVRRGLLPIRESLLPPVWGQSKVKIVTIHSEGQPDSVLFPHTSSWMIDSVVNGAANEPAPNSRDSSSSRLGPVLSEGGPWQFVGPILCLRLWFFPFRRGGLKMIGLSRNHPRRQPWLVTNSRDLFTVLPFGAGPCGGQPRLCLSKS